MDVDELIFEQIVKFFKRRKKKAVHENENSVHLNSIRTRLLIMARALTGKSIEIFEAEREGGYKDNNFFLPSNFSYFKKYEENLSFYFYRICYLAIQQELGLNWNIESTPNSQTAQQRALESASIVLPVMHEQYPLAFTIHEQLKAMIENTHSDKNETIDFTWLYGKWMKNENTSTQLNQLSHFSDNIDSNANQKEITTIKAKAIEEIKRIEVDKKQQEDYVLTHNFEKVETAEEFDGVWRDFDGEDELEKHQDALDDLNMKFTVRVDDTSHSVYQAEFIENSNISESAEKNTNDAFIYYPEWDYVHKKYKENFCRVFPKKQIEVNPEYYQNTIKEHQSILLGMRKTLVSINNKRIQQRKQTDGSEFDLDAIIDLYTDVRCNTTPSEKIYLSTRKKEKDLAILLLLDNSLSSDGYVAGNRVLDIEKKVSILFGEILNEFQVSFSISGFYSKTRNHLHYITQKGFNEKWDTSKNKVGAIEPCGYTRIGAALRHAGYELKQQEAKNKWLILLSDGKPNDYDKYEGKHGINDTKQALRELKQNNINSFAMAIEAEARYYLPQMFGQNHYRILSEPNELLPTLIALFEKIRLSS